MVSNCLYRWYPGIIDSPPMISWVTWVIVHWCYISISHINVCFWRRIKRTILQLRRFRAVQLDPHPLLAVCGAAATVPLSVMDRWWRWGMNWDESETRWWWDVQVRDIHMPTCAVFIKNLKRIWIYCNACRWEFVKTWFLIAIVCQIIILDYDS